MILSVGLAATLYFATFALVLVWTGWSIRKHGWCRRSLRRFSYLLFLLLLAVRLAWCAVLLAYLHERPVDEMHALRSTPAVVLDHAAFLVHFLAFSMLVCGWADSTYMMMSGRSLVRRSALAAHRAPMHRRASTPQSPHLCTSQCTREPDSDEAERARAIPRRRLSRRRNQRPCDRRQSSITSAARSSP